MSLSTFIFMRDKIFRKFSLYDDMMIYFKKLGYFVVQLDSRSKAGMKTVTNVVMDACKEKIERDRKRGIKNRPVRAMVVGIPNVGKSTILSVITSAKPKIANYHFTTLTPNLGVVKRYDDSFVVADIPGLIEGAAEGAGLGHDFLRHIERTRLLVHVLDISGSEGRDPIEDYRQIRKELSDYSDKLAELPELIAANKMDITGAEDYLEFLKEELEGTNAEIFPVSAATTKGFEPLLDRIVEFLRVLPSTREFAEDDIIEAPQYDWNFEITKDDDVFVVTGGIVDYILDTTNAEDDESMRRFQKLLESEGIIEALRKAGADSESVIRLGEWEFDFIE